MTDREICEKIVERDDCLEGRDCNSCFLRENCFNLSEEVRGVNSAVYSAKKYLAEHPADNELGEKGDRFTNHTHWPEDMNITVGSPRAGDEWEEFLLTGDEWEWEREEIPNGVSIRYRKRQPKAPTVEELAEENKRLKIKCNQYAKRLVLEGFDDVEWEAE